MPAIELVVTDLDGTFWHTDDHVPPTVLAAVAELARRGIPLLVATGRRLASTREPLARVGLAPPAIMLNGAIGLDLASLTAAPKDQSKWDGVVAYCALRGIDCTRILAVADGPNDIELLTNGVVRAVPEVAHPSALALATHIIPAAQHGGWADIIALLD